MDKYLEYTAVALGIIYILLATRSIIWCWPAGILSCAIYIYIAYNAHLYLESILQVFYVVAGFYGWYHWHKKETKEEENFMNYNLRQSIKLFLPAAVLVPVFGFVFAKVGNSYPYLDAAVAVFSLVATWMNAKKILQGWLLWIGVDIAAAVLYYLKGYYPTTILYMVYTIMPVYGYFEWRRQMKLA